MIDWRPLADKVIVKKIKEEDEVSSSGLIVISNEKNDKTKRAEVVAVGRGTYIDGQLVPLMVNVGDIVVYNGTYGTDIGSFHEEHKNEYMILHEQDILAVVQQ